MAWVKRCEICSRPILMAKVLPPGEYRRRWLPFDDPGLTCCHLDTCEGNAKNYELYCNDCMEYVAATRKEWFLEQCPECGSDNVE